MELRAWPHYSLPRYRVNSESIEDSLVVAPDAERKRFLTRHEYDAVVLCDESSVSISASPALTSLMRAVYEVEFKKILRNIPIILVGGVSAWRNELGAGEIIASGAETSLAAPGSSRTSVFTSAGFAPPSPQAPYTNGIIAPAPRLNGMMPPLAPLPSPSIASSALSAHTRVPAESSTSAQYGSSPLVDSTGFARGRSGTEPTPEVNGYKMWVPPANVATPDISTHTYVFLSSTIPAAKLKSFAMVAGQQGRLPYPTTSQCHRHWTARRP